MGILVSRVNEQPWRISSRLEFLMLMDKWLPSSASSMVLPLPLPLPLMWLWLFLMHFIALGHGGARTAEYLKNNLFKNFVTHDEFISDTKKAIGNMSVKKKVTFVCFSFFLCFLPESFDFGSTSV